MVSAPSTTSAPKKAALQSNQAQVVVELPASANLFVNGDRVTLTSAKRVVVTPELQPGMDYSYTLRAEQTTNGKLLAEQKRVTVRAGQTSLVQFGSLNSDQASTAPAHVTVRLPAEARLLVDGLACPLTSTTRSFDTPPLERGMPYYYTVRAELMKNGETHTQVRRILVEADKAVIVDFGDLSAVTSVRR